ncbi:MAG: type transport system permease protein [Actinomycetota bacterium]|jgi:ABC-2 type transport system permease protein|nr:type transport system permease protein [Actinomycetota bacterium]
MSAASLALRQVKYENRSFWRNPAAAFFTFVFPLMFLVIFNLLFGENSNFYVPAIAAFSVITACYTNVAMSISFSRDQGVLKRKRGTPLPGWAFLGGRVIHSTLIAVLLVAIVTVFGAVFYNVDIPTSTLPAFLVTLIVGAAAFSALGLAITSIVPNADAAPAVINATILPLLFISDIFIPLDDAPGWLLRFADFFPIRHYSTAMQAAFNPDAFHTSSGFEGTELAIVAAWGVIGIILAIRFFSWEPRR